MIGAIIGDIIGSVYEAHNIKRNDFELFDAHSRFTETCQGSLPEALIAFLESDNFEDE